MQNDDGGWGESPESYADSDLKGVGPSTACQTAWAILGLVSAGDPDGESVRRGIDYLKHHQEGNGGWCDEGWTGTGFPEVFYLDYHYYATYFPLYALELTEQLRRARPGLDPTDGPRRVETQI